MRHQLLALAGAAAGLMLAATAPVQAYEGSFFLEPPDHSGTKASFPAPAPAYTAPAPAYVPPAPAYVAPTPEPATYSPPADLNETRPLVSPIPRETVAYDGPYGAGTIIISTTERRLYLVLPGRQALRYGVGVGRPGFDWSGTKTVVAKREWPDWTPPPDMIKRRPDLPHHMVGGIENPLGARAMYLGGTMYRIHGSNEPDTIGQAVSSGCIRMTNDDVSDLYDRVKIGSKAVVLR